MAIQQETLGERGSSVAPVIELHPRENGGVLLETATSPIKTNFAKGQVRAGREMIDWKVEVPETLHYFGLAEFVPGYLGVERTSDRPRGALAQEGIATLSHRLERAANQCLQASKTRSVYTS